MIIDYCFLLIIIYHYYKLTITSHYDNLGISYHCHFLIIIYHYHKMNLPLPIPLLADGRFPEAKQQKITQGQSLHDRQSETTEKPAKSLGRTVEQVHPQAIASHTRDLLERLMSATSTIQISNLVCTQYQGDGRDLNYHYKAILQRISSLNGPRKRKAASLAAAGYSHDVYQKGLSTLKCILETFKLNHPESFLYHAYPSILQDLDIDLAHRIDVFDSIENKALRFWMIKKLQNSTSFTQGQAIPEEHLNQALDTLWHSLELEPPTPFAQDLLYTFLNTDPDSRSHQVLALLQEHMPRQGKKVDWKSCREYREQMAILLQKLDLRVQDWSSPFVELAQNASLSVEHRLCALYYVLDEKNYEELQKACFRAVDLNGTLEFFRAFLELGHEASFVELINRSPERAGSIPGIVLLESFDRLRTSKILAIEALSEFYAYELQRLSILKETLGLGYVRTVEDLPERGYLRTLTETLGPDYEKILEAHLANEGLLKSNILLIEEKKLEINTIYPLYRIILEKRIPECRLETLLEDKKDRLFSLLDCPPFQGKRVYLNSQAYNLPSVFDPEYQEGYEDITFNFFLNKIGAAMSAQHSLPEYGALFEAWKAILTDPRYTVVQTLLDAQEADDNPYVLKMTALAAGLIDLFQKGLAQETAYDKQAAAEAEAAYEKAIGLIQRLVFNLQTCPGGQLQAIDQSYSALVDGEYSSIENPKQAALNIALNSLYTIRNNWVMESEVSYTEAGKMVKYSPRVADGVFINALTKYLNQEALMQVYACDEAGLADYTFLKHRNPKKDSFGRTHIGHDILGIAGVEIGLVGEEEAPVYDINAEADSWFLTNTVSDKRSIVSAFVESFTFEAIWEPLGELIWKKTAEESSFGMLVYKDKACSHTLNLDIYEDHEGIVARQDPLAKGMVRFLSALGLCPDACCETMEVYYKDPLVDLEAEDVSSIPIYTKFSKAGLAQILHKLQLLTVEDIP